MATTAATTISGITANATKTDTQRTTLSNDFDDFLRLLTTQLQNQDPLNPMDSNEFTNQLVQFSQVEQQINTNQKLDSMVSLQLSSSISAALGYVGLDINYISAETNFDGTTPVDLTYALKSEVKEGKLSIVNEDGETVFSRDISGEEGTVKWTWDGKNAYGEVQPTGTYSIRIDGLDANDDAISASVVVEGRVRGIETQDGTIYLLVGDRAVPMSNVLNAAVPATSEQSST